MMDRKQFIEQMIEQVRSITLTSVVGSRIPLKKRGKSGFGLCPFHNDTKLGSFVVTDGKQIWKCFSCGEGGDGIKFVSQYEGINYLESAFKLALEFGVISAWEYDEYFARRRYRRDVIMQIERKYTELDKKKMENNIADVDTLHKVFSVFIDACDLSDEHKKYLMEERGLTEDEIKKGKYFTFPSGYKRLSILNKIRKEFGSDEVLERIPGFFKKVEDNTFYYAKHKGIGIGIQNADGKIVGIQIRHDDKGDYASRYVWFSSSFAIGDGEKYDCGTSSGSPIDVVYPDEITNRTVFITEGRFKANQIAKTTGSIAISVQGVNTWRGILKELKAILKSPITHSLFKKGKFYIHCLLIAFDADLSYKFQVFQQLQAMTDEIEKCGYNVYYLNWDDKYGKGIDDVLLAGHKSAIKRFDKEVWDKAYNYMLDQVLKNEPYKELAKVPLEVMRDYFDRYVKPLKPLKPNELSEKHIKKIQKIS